MYLSFSDRKNLKRIKWLLLGVLVLQNIVYMILDVVDTFLSIPVKVYFRMGIVEIAAFIIPILLYYQLVKADNSDFDFKESWSLTHISPKLALILFLGGICGQFLMIVLNIPANILVSGMTKGGYVPVEPPKTLLDLGLSVIFLAVIPAILEEILMRGMVFGAVKKLDTGVAVLFTTLMFAVMHPDITSIMGILFFGAFLAAIIVRTNSLYGAILFHFANNLTASVFDFFADRLGAYQTVGLVFASAAAFILLAILFFKMTPRPKRLRSKHPVKVLKQTLFNLPIFLCFLIAIIVQYIRIMV